MFGSGTDIAHTGPIFSSQSFLLLRLFHLLTLCPFLPAPHSLNLPFCHQTNRAQTCAVQLKFSPLGQRRSSRRSWSAMKDAAVRKLPAAKQDRTQQIKVNSWTFQQGEEVPSLGRALGSRFLLCVLAPGVGSFHQVRLSRRCCVRMNRFFFCFFFCTNTHNDTVCAHVLIQYTHSTRTRTRTPRLRSHTLCTIGGFEGSGSETC